MTLDRVSDMPAAESLAISTTHKQVFFFFLKLFFDMRTVFLNGGNPYKELQF